MDPLLLAAGAGVAVGAALQSATGFGFAVLAAPLMFAALEPREAIGLLLLLGMTTGRSRSPPRAAARARSPARA